MTPELLRQLGEALYGDRFVAAMARDLGLDPRTIRYWLSGTKKPRMKHLRALAEIMKAHETTHADLLKQLEVIASTPVANT